MKSITLYEIEEAYENMLSQAIDEETGELKLEFEKQFDELTELREKKIINTGLYIKNIKSYIDALKTEEDSLKKRRQVAKNAYERLKQYLSNVLDGEQIKTPQIEIKWRKSKRVEQTPDFDIDAIEKTFPKLIRIKKELDKTAAKKEIEGGVGITGLKLIETQNIQIK